MPQLHFHVQALGDVDGHFRAVKLERIAPVLFGAVHGHVSVAQQLAGVLPVFGINADPQTGGDTELIILNQKLTGKRFQ